MLHVCVNMTNDATVFPWWLVTEKFITVQRKGDEMKQWQVVQAILSISQCFVSHAARHGNAAVSGQTLFLLTSFSSYSHDARNQG